MGLDKRIRKLERSRALGDMRAAQLLTAEYVRAARWADASRCVQELAREDPLLLVANAQLALTVWAQSRYVLPRAVMLPVLERYAHQQLSKSEEERGDAHIAMYDLRRDDHALRIGLRYGGAIFSQSIVWDEDGGYGQHFISVPVADERRLRKITAAVQRLDEMEAIPIIEHMAQVYRSLLLYGAKLC